MKRLFVKSKSRSIPKGILFGMILLLFTGCIFCSAFAGEIQLAWNANSEMDLSGYRIYKGLQSGTYTSTVKIDKSATSVVMTGLQAGKTYYFAATAINENDLESDYSNEVVYSVPVTTVTYSITASSSGNGTITPSGTNTVNAGSSLTYAMAPATGCKVSDVIVDGASLGSLTSYTFSAVSANHTIQAVFAPLSWTITASSSGNGTITPSGTSTVNAGASITYAIAPATGCKVSDVVVDGSSLGSRTSYTFSTVSANHTILAVFTPMTWTIAASSTGNGTLSPSGSIAVNYGSNVTFTMTPVSGYRLSSVIVDGSSVGSLTSYTFSAVSANHTIQAVFVPLTWTITASSSGNGTITPSGTSTVDSGASLRYTIDAGTGYKVSCVYVDGVSLGFLASYTFSAVSANHTIHAVFTPVAWTITASSTGNGTLSPSGSIAVNDGSDITFTMTPVSGYRVSDVVVDGVSQGVGDSITFTSVNANHVMTVSFLVENSAPQADAGPDQIVTEDSSVGLSGENTTDAEGDTLSYSWSQLEGPSVELSNSETVTPVFQSPVVGSEGASLVFQLTVQDDKGLESTDTCIVNVTSGNNPPVADAGDNQVVSEGLTVTLDASLSSDPNDDMLTYRWTQTAGLPVTLSDASSSQPFFITPDVTMDGTSLVFQLTVTDAGGLKSQDICIVNVTWNNEAPVADAGTDQDAGSGETVTLNGGNSSDPDDGISSYRWTQVSGTPVTLSDPTAAAPVFTAPGVTVTSVLEFQLTVTDFGGLQSSDNCVITIYPAEEEYDTVQYSLRKSWNLIKMTGTPVNADIASALISIKGKYSSVWCFEGGKWLIYYPNYKTNSLTTIENGKEYWIYMRTNAVLEIEIR